MDVGTASAVVAGSFAASTPFKPEACSWAVSEIAGARPQQAARGPRSGLEHPARAGQTAIPRASTDRIRIAQLRTSSGGWARLCNVVAFGPRYAFPDCVSRTTIWIVTVDQ